jgi:hypothetical protein
MDTKQAEQKLDWIKARIAEGHAVYFSTHLRRTKITAKHLPLIRVRNGSLEIQCGKHWIDYSYANLSAA